MLEPLRTSNPLTGSTASTGSAPLASPLAGLASPSTAGLGSDGELPASWFAREVERVRDQDRSEHLSLARQGELRDDRRLARHEGFESTADGTPREPADLPQARPTEGAPSPRAEGVALASEDDPGALAQAAEAAAPAAPDARPPGSPSASSAANPSTTPAPQTPVLPQATLPTPPPQPPAVTPGANGTTATAVTRVEAPAQVFANAARGKGASGLPGRATPQAPQTDSALLERAEEVLRQIKLKVGPGARRITIDLQPAELGRVSAHFVMRQGKVAARLRVERPETLELLERQLPELKSALSQGGVEIESLELELAGDPTQAGGSSSHEQRGFTRTFGATFPTPPTTAPEPPSAGTARAPSTSATDNAVDFLA